MYTLVVFILTKMLLQHGTRGRSAMSRFYNPWTQKIEGEVKINRDDIEQALSWFTRMSALETSKKDQDAFDRLLQVTLHMRSLGIGDE